MERKQRQKAINATWCTQVGKTWIMRHFGEHEYKKVAYVNCDDEPRIKQLFELDYDIDRILVTLQAITGVKITSADTLIILDEIQEIPRGLHSLKILLRKKRLNIISWWQALCLA